MTTPTQSSVIAQLGADVARLRRFAVAEAERAEQAEKQLSDLLVAHQTLLQSWTTERARRQQLSRELTELRDNIRHHQETDQ